MAKENQKLAIKLILPTIEPYQWRKT